LLFKRNLQRYIEVLSAKGAMYDEVAMSVVGLCVTS
jgi:hypothetical protein